MKKILFFALVILTFTAPATARAADANVEKLKGIFEKILKYQKDINTQTGGGLEYDGAVMVEPVDNYYAVTLPHARIKYPDGRVFDIGMISINASPGNTAGQWKMAIAVPTPMAMINAAKQQEVKISIGGQKAAGIYDEALENFAKLDAQYTDIVIENPAEQTTVRMPDTKIMYDFQKAPDGKWAGPADIIIKNLAANIGPQKLDVKIAEIRMDSDMKGYDPAALKNFHDKIAAMSPSPTDTVPSPLKKSDLSPMLEDLFFKSIGSFTVDYALSGLEINAPDKTSGQAKSIKIGRGNFGIIIDDVMTDKLNFGLKFGYDGFVMNPVAPGYEGVLPSMSNMDIMLRSFPARQIFDVATNTMSGAVGQPDMAPMAGLMLMSKLPAIMAAAGTTIEIKNNFIGGSDYRFDVNGSAKADMASVMSFVGKFKGVFSGLDTLIGRVQALASNPQNPGAAEASSMLGSLQMLQSQGKKEGDKYIYDFELTPQGQMNMNGAPMNVFGAAPPAAPLP
jgi:hypothetical protein